MRVTVSHNQPKQEVIRRIDQSLDEVFKSIGNGFIQIANERRLWSGDRLDFSFSAVTGFMTLPVKGFVLVEDTQATIDIDLPAFVGNFIPEQKMTQGIESKVKALLT